MPNDTDRSSDLAPSISPGAAGSGRRKAAAVLLVGGWINLALVTVQGIVLVPLYLTYVGARLYGAWLGSGDIVGWLTLLDLGLGSLLVQRVSAAFMREDTDEVGAYLTGGMAVLMVLATLIGLAAVPMAGQIPSWMGIVGTEARILSGCFILAALAGSLSILNNGVQSLALALQRPALPMAATVFSTAGGLVLTVVLLLDGAGLWSLAIGLFARSASLLAVNVVYAGVLYRRHVAVRAGFRRHVFRDIASLSGPAMMAQLGGAAAGRSEAALIAIFLRPELATVFVLTRRAAEIVGMVLDRIGGAVYPGFAQIAADARGGSLKVLDEVLVLFGAFATVMVALYWAFNPSFMTLWVGPSFFGGRLLTLLIGLSTILTARSTLTCYLYGATGRIRESAWLTFSASALRLTIMVVLLWAWGLPGLPTAGVIAAGLVSEMALTRLGKDLSAPERRPAREFRWAHIALLTAGAFAGVFLSIESWASFTVFLMIGTIIGGSVMAVSEPSIRVTLHRFVRR